MCKCGVPLGYATFRSQSECEGDVVLPIGDPDYVALRRIHSDQQLEMEEGNEVYTIPDSNPMYMSIDPHTMQGKTERRRERMSG